MTKPNEGVMTRIMKLLNLANNEGATDAERRLAEEQAERLMAKHMIDRFEAEQKAKDAGNTVRKPIQDVWEVQMSVYKSDENSDVADANTEFDFAIIAMMRSVLEHCNIRVNHNFNYPNKVIYEGTPQERIVTDTSRRAYTIVGFPEDIAYAERIWFNVFRTFVSNVNPKWDPQKSLEWNAYNFASAGVSWKQQVLIAEKAGDDRIEKPWRYQGEDRKQPFFSSWQAGTLIDPGNEAWGRSIHRLKRACKKYCTENKVDYPYAAGAKLRVATRSSFARSYRQTISERLKEIRQVANDDVDVDRDKFALAVQDTRQRVDEEFYRLFPEHDPEVQRKKREAEEASRLAAWAILSPEEQERELRRRLEEQMRWEAESKKARRSYRALREDPANRYDAAAWNRGRAAAQSVNLRDDGEVVREQRKGIE